jgi:hypothetical protein
LELAFAWRIYALEADVARWSWERPRQNGDVPWKNEQKCWENDDSIRGFRKFMGDDQVIQAMV